MYQSNRFISHYCTDSWNYIFFHQIIMIEIMQFEFLQQLLCNKFSSEKKRICVHNHKLYIHTQHLPLLIFCRRRNSDTKRFFKSKAIQRLGVEQEVSLHKVILLYHCSRIRVQRSAWTQPKSSTTPILVMYIVSLHQVNAINECVQPTIVPQFPPN